MTITAQSCNSNSQEYYHRIGSNFFHNSWWTLPQFLPQLCLCCNHHYAGHRRFWVADDCTTTEYHPTLPFSRQHVAVCVCECVCEGLYPANADEVEAQTRQVGSYGIASKTCTSHQPGKGQCALLYGVPLHLDSWLPKKWQSQRRLQRTSSAEKTTFVLKLLCSQFECVGLSLLVSCFNREQIVVLQHQQATRFVFYVLNINTCRFRFLLLPFHKTQNKNKSKSKRPRNY